MSEGGDTTGLASPAQQVSHEKGRGVSLGSFQNAAVDVPSSLNAPCTFNTDSNMLNTEFWLSNTRGSGERAHAEPCAIVFDGVVNPSSSSLTSPFTLTPEEAGAIQKRGASYPGEPTPDGNAGGGLQDPSSLDTTFTREQEEKEQGMCTDSMLSLQNVYTGLGFINATSGLHEEEEEEDVQHHTESFCTMDSNMLSPAPSPTK